jgi:DnaJ-class molecular chaperone
MLFVISSLFFAGPINTSDLLDLDFYQLTNLRLESNEADILRSYQRFRAHQAKATALPRHRARLLEKTSFAYDIIGSPDSRVLYDFVGTNFLNFTGFQVMGYQSDVTIQALKRMMGTLPDNMEKYGGMIFFPVQFDIVDFLTGAEKVVTVERTVKCECPKGKPRCEQCLKQRFFLQTVREKIILPPGAIQYHRIISKGLGDSPGGRGAADIVFVAYMKPDPHFERRGANVHRNVSVSIADVILGKSILVENFDGEKIEISIKGGIRDGEEKRVEGKGLPFVLEPTKRGDFVVSLFLEAPKQLPDAQRKFLLDRLPDDPSAYE